MQPHVTVPAQSNSSDPFESQQNLAGLLNGVRHLVTRFVVLPGPEYADAVTLWITHAHAIKAATTSPRLIFKSPEKSSGKTRALEILETLVPAPLNTVNASVAAVFRLLKEEQATLLLDEVDSIFNAKAEHDDLRGLLNAGHKRGATVVRVVGERKNMHVERFPVFAATALAAIGNLPETIESRAIIVPMRRRAPDEPVEPFRLRKIVTETDTLRMGLRQWAESAAEELTDSEPSMPAELTDRQADCWEPLIAVADLAGEQWAGRARAAAIHIAGGQVIDEASTGVQLLGDIRACFGSEARIPSISLLAKLNAMDEAQWGGWHDGKGMTARDLARRLKPFGIGSRPIRPVGGGEPFKGYVSADFTDAWQRYPLPHQETVTSVSELQPSIPGNRVTVVTDHRGEKENGSRGSSDGDVFDEAFFASLADAGAGAEDDDDSAQRGHERYAHHGRQVECWTRDGGEQVCEDCHPKLASRIPPT